MTATPASKNNLSSDKRVTSLVNRIRKLTLATSSLARTKGISAFTPPELKGAFSGQGGVLGSLGLSTMSKKSVMDLVQKLSDSVCEMQDKSLGLMDTVTEVSAHIANGSKSEGDVDLLIA